MKQKKNAPFPDVSKRHPYGMRCVIEPGDVQVFEHLEDDKINRGW